MKFVAEVREKSAKATRTLIFLAYPSLATTIVRTFVCEKARDTNGKPTSWLSDDLLVECSVDKADYNFMRIYAWRTSKSHYNIQCSEICTLINEKFHTEN